MKKVEPLSIRGFFAGKSVLLTGSTGFLAKAVVEKILRDLPEIGQIYLLIRPRVKADGSRVDPRERLRDEILRNSAFRRLREQLGDKFESFCETKVTCICGDLTREKLGMDPLVYAELAGKVDVVMNSAATVVFDERLDWALDLNTLGPQGLLEFARQADAAFVQVSTAYVSGRRTGQVPEELVDPLDAIDVQLPPGVKRPEKFELVEEIARLRELVQSVKKDCEKLASQKGWRPDSEEATQQLRKALVGAGMRRAQSLGWNDTYTYTKYLGEQYVRMRHGRVKTVIVRPAIIESSLQEPEPGWLDGLRMADPIIIGFGKGRLDDFPADENVVLDIIPADLVVNTILAAGAYIATQGKSFDVFTIASSNENPLVFRSLYEHVRDYFQKHPMTDRAGRPVAVPEWKFPSLKKYRSRMRNRYLRPIQAASAVLNGPLPLPGMRRMRSRLRTLNTTLEQLLYYVDIYGPYVTLDCRFKIDKTRALLAQLPPEERTQFNFDPRAIRWKNYIQDVHIPGLKRNILRMDTLPRTGAGEGKLLEEESQAVRRRVSASPRGVPQTLVDICARGAERFGTRSCAEIRRTAGLGSELTRFTFLEMWERSGQLARKLIARLGLHPGDRVMLVSENCPEWALAYMAISRACCTAVPLDRAMPARQAAALVAVVDAKAVIVSPAVLQTAREVVGSDYNLPVCLNLLNDLEPHSGNRWPYPEASLGERALREPSPEMLASILFTSGTTLEPKGVMLSHGNLVADALSVSEVLEPLESDRFLSVLPMHHALEFTCGCIIPMYGGSNVFHIEALSAKNVLDTMKLAEITVVLGVPRLYKLFMDGIKAQLEAAGISKRLGVRLGRNLAAALEKAGNSSARRRIFKEVHDAFGGNIRLFVSGGAALDPEIFEFFESFGIPICEGYGLTETAPVLTVNPLSAPKAGSVGLPVPGAEISIASPDGHGIGEVLARGPMVMQGYWRNPAATEKSFENGWFRTGDLGRLDRQGYLHITGRLKDVIITGAGKNVYPDELEAALGVLPGAKEFTVIGLPARSGMGEEVAVVAVAESENAKPGIEAAIERVNRTLPSHQRVARIEFHPKELPKTSTLKVQRSKLQAQYSGQLRGELAPASHALELNEPAGPRGDCFIEVARAVAEVAGRIAAADVRPEMKLQMDLGVDSIGRVDLLQKLELQLDISIPHESEGKLFTVRDVVTVVQESIQSGKRSGDKHTRRPPGEVPVLRSSLSKMVLQNVFTTSASVFMNTWFRVECQGLENLPTSGPYILAANHCSHLDSVAIREVLGKRATELHVMGAKDYFFDTRLKSWFFSTFLNALPFDREERAAEALALCKRVLDAGRAILIFPEGTRSLTGELQAFKPGIGLLGVELDAPVIPVHLAGTFESLPKGSSLPRPTRIDVRIGKPVDFSLFKKERGKSVMSDVYRRAASELRAQLERVATGSRS